MPAPSILSQRDLDDSYHRLCDWMAAQGSIVLAYSGGVDSALLLAVAQKALPRRVLAVTFDTGTLPAFERERAAQLARSLGANYRILDVPMFENSAFKENCVNRCYLCKKFLFSRLVQLAMSEEIPHIIEGSNLSDDADDRPGMRAVREAGIKSPLLELGIDKPTVRALAKREKLPCWNAPARACLATRIPRGIAVTQERVRRIELLERTLLALGFTDVRAREDATGSIVRLEIFPEELDLATSPAMRSLISEAGLQSGYSRVSLDLNGLKHSNGSKISTNMEFKF